MNQFHEDQQTVRFWQLYQHAQVSSRFFEKYFLNNRIIAGKKTVVLALGKDNPQPPKGGFWISKIKEVSS